MKAKLCIALLYFCFGSLLAQNEQTSFCMLPDTVEAAFNIVEERNRDLYKSAFSTMEQYLSSSPEIEDTCRAYLYHRMGLSARGKSSLEIIDLYKNAYQAYVKQGPQDDDFVIRLLINISRRYQNLGGLYRIDSFPVFVKKAYELELQRPQFSDQYHRTCHYIAYHYADIGNYDNAALFFKTAIEHYQKDPDPRRQYNLADAYNDLSWLYSTRLEDSDQGIVFAQRALEIPDLDLDRSIYFRSNLALAYLEKAKQLDKETGQEYYSKALSTYAQVLKDCESDPEWFDFVITRCLNNMSVIQNRTAQYNDALNSVNKVIKMNEGYPEELAKNYDNLGDALARQGKQEDALKAYNQSLSYGFVNFPTDPNELPGLENNFVLDKMGALTTLLSKANIYTQQGQSNPDKLKIALAHFELMDQLIQNIRQDFFANASKFSLAAKAKPIYEQAIRTCLSINEKEASEGLKAKAFYFAEQSKAVTLLELMNNQKAARLTLSKESQDSLFYLLQLRDLYEKELALANLDQDEEMITVFRDRALKFRALVESYQKELIQDPNYKRLLANNNSFSLSSFQQEHLDEDKALLEFFIGDSSQYLFVLDQKKLDIHKIESDNMELQVKNLIKAITEPFGLFTNNTEAYYINQFIDHGRSLYQSLIAPIKNLSQKLIIVPDAYLLYLPFETLLSKDTEARDWSSLPYLLKEKQISYSYSAALLQEMERKKSTHKAKKTWGSFAPVFPIEDFPDNKIPNYAYSGDYALAVAKSFGNKAFYKLEANKSNFIEKAPDYQVLQLATHGVIDDRDANLVKFIFWKDSVFLNDLYSLQLNADLVILNSCETNLGQYYSGEGVISLNRGFVSAGVGSVLATLWETKDFFTPQFMPPFLEGIKAKQGKDAALRQAKLAMLDQEDTSAPFYWSAYVLYGDSSPLELKQNFNYGPWIIGLGLISILFAYFVWKRKRIN